jgi:hypothetical protein
MAGILPNKITRALGIYPETASWSDGGYGSPGTAPLLSVRGVLASDDGSVRVPFVSVLGVDDGFWALGDTTPLLQSPDTDVGILNERVAARLGAKVGDTVLLRVEKPGRIPGDSPFSEPANASVAIRFSVRAIVDEAHFGRFSLTDSQVAPLNVYIPLKWLQAKLGLEGKANLILSGGFSNETYLLDEAKRVISNAWRLADAEMSVAPLKDLGLLELRTRRVFLEPQVGAAADKVDPNAEKVLTYFVNELRVGEKATPYSMVAAR